jgi:hypothetical protein
VAENTTPIGEDGKPTLETAWMWPTEDGGVNGVKIDTERGLIQWFDEIGCACGDSDILQSYEHYAENGPAFPNAPEDVLAGLAAAVTVLNPPE